MLKMYHYAKPGNTILTNGLKSIRSSGCNLQSYTLRAGSNDPEKIFNWLESTFDGRSNSISCLTERIIWQGNDKALEFIAKNYELFSFDLQRLVNDGIVCAIWCKYASDVGGYNEKFKKVNLNEIDFSPLPWQKCNSKQNLLFGVIRHYMLVLKNGYIPPKYINRENDSHIIFSWNTENTYTSNIYINFLIKNQRAFHQPLNNRGSYSK